MPLFLAGSPQPHLYSPSPLPPATSATTMGNPAFRRRPSRSTPDVDTVESSLRLCSLAAPTTSPDVSVNLNSEVPLPHLWQQVLNLQTGEIYYINKSDGTKTTVDPRGTVAADEDSEAEAESDPESTVDDASYDGSRSSSGCSSSSSCREGGCSSASSTLSVGTNSSSSANSCAIEAPAGEVLVLVGCRICLTLSMAPRTAEECPKCFGAALVRF